MLFFRKIQTRERAEILLGGCVVGPRRFCLDGESSKIMDDATNCDRSPPRFIHVPRIKFPDALELGRASDLVTAVRLVFGSRGKAQIRAAIIKAVAVDMVHATGAGGVHEKPVHQHVLAVNFGGRVAVRAASRQEKPTMLRKLEQILSVYQRECATRERHEIHAAPP